MFDLHRKLLLILDDREYTSGDVRSLVGLRRYGEIIYQRRALAEHFIRALPDWASSRLLRLQSDDDLANLRSVIESCSEDTGLCVIAGRAGFTNTRLLNQLIERLPYAEEDFTDSLYKPLLVFLRSAHSLVDHWSDFRKQPLHSWEVSWLGSQRLQSMKPLDLGQIRDFLSFTCQSTSTRHFNEVHIDTYYYTKKSRDKAKMLAEYSFYGLIPEQMRTWLIQPFDYHQDDEFASYKTLRYYLADSALQWVHGAFEVETFTPFVERLLFFLSERPQKPCAKDQSIAKARELFVGKLEMRVADFLAREEGRRINQLAVSSDPALDISHQLERYLKIFKKSENQFAFNFQTIGHGDPCFSNVLYDQQRYLLKFIDPKGAVKEEDLWTHPLYDLCKISHSVLGNYDFINNGLYHVEFTDHNDMVLNFTYTNQASLKDVFLKKVKDAGYDIQTLRLGEASLFLSMLPLHMDYPNKVLAFLLNARQILDEVECEK